MSARLIIQIILTVAKSPVVNQVFRHYTGKNLTMETALEQFKKTRIYNQLEIEAKKAASSVTNAYHFDPKNPAHYRATGQETPLSMRLKALKSAATAASEAVQATHKGQHYNAAEAFPSARPDLTKPQPKTIKRSDRMIDH